MSETLFEVIEAESVKVAELGKDGFKDVPLLVLQRAIGRIASAALPFTDWLSEPEAKLRSSRSVEWLRTQFPAWESQGLARWNPARPKTRQYLRCVVPLRANLSAARDAGRREALGG
jgi:hypothetical protein